MAEKSRTDDHDERIRRLEIDSALATKESQETDRWQNKAEERITDLEKFMVANRALVWALIKAIGALGTILGIVSFILKVTGKL